jgi:hypothetical protein
MHVRIVSFVLGLLLGGFQAATGQSIDTLVHLSPPSKSGHFAHPFFDKIIVIDNRFDTSRVISYVSREGHLIPMRVDTTVSIAVRAYIEEATKDVAKSGKTLLLELRRFEVNSAGPLLSGLHIAANAYYNTVDSGFIQFASLDTIFSLVAYQRPKTKNLLEGRAFDVLLEKIDREDGFGSSGVALSLQTIRHRNVMSDWSKYPINNTIAYPSGVYEFYQLFRRNQIEKFGLSLKMREDSVYVVTFTDSLPDDKQRVNNWVRITRGQGVLSYEGKLFFMVQYPLCVPLRQMNNSFYFHIPATLPNRYYFDFAHSQAEEFNMEPVSSFSDMTSNILGFWINDAGVQSIIRKGIKDPTLRDCYIDLDTGIVRYF